jgi:hypothetical protein
MNRLCLTALLLFLSLPGCLVTTGEIRGNKFFVQDDFTVDLPNSEWEVVRQQVFVDLGIRRPNSVFEVSFNHKKSNGFIGVNSMKMTEVDQARSLEVHADGAVTSMSGIKLSQRMIKVDGIDAIEVVISGKYMRKYIFLKKGSAGYELIYMNTPAYFDQYLGDFDTFVGSFRAF